MRSLQFCYYFLNLMGLKDINAFSIICAFFSYGNCLFFTISHMLIVFLKPKTSKYIIGGFIYTIVLFTIIAIDRSLILRIIGNFNEIISESESLK